VNQVFTAESGTAARFESLLGRQYVLSDPVLLKRFVIDGTEPQLVIQPQNAEQIAAALAIASEQDWSVVPFGSGTRQHLGGVPDRIDIVLSTERLNAVERYDPGDLTIALQAGVQVKDAVQLCAKHQQLLPVEALSNATIGGALATGENGPLRAGFGASRDFCIGINFITGDAVSGRGGGRVVKNVAGYDLMKLMIGSYGTLGVIVSANFKLFPLPKQTITCVCEFSSLAETVQFRDWLLKSPLTPIAAEIISPSAVEYLSDTEPRDPDEWAPDSLADQLDHSWQLAVRFAGSDRVLTRCRTELGSSIAGELIGSEEVKFWKGLSGFEERMMKRHSTAMVFQVSVPIADVQSAMEAAELAATEYNFIALIIGRATVGSLVVAFIPLAIDPPNVAQFAGAASDFRSRLSKASSAVVSYCPVEAKHHFDVWGSTPTDVDLMQRIKRTLDPKGILNRGRFLLG
jgi:glycolate oxidase FAD binding subunit